MSRARYVMVELIRRDDQGIETVMVKLRDEPDLRVGAIGTLDDGQEWTITAVHRCRTRHGTVDHTRCFL